jgi:hypothetical protein
MRIPVTISGIFLMILFSCTNNHKRRPITAISKNDSLRNIVQELSRDNSIGDNIGIAGSTHRHDLYTQLNKTATTKELESLTNHEGPAVRYYSFRALVNRHSENVYDILLKHMNDTMPLLSFSGCSGTEETVAWNMVMLVKSKVVEPTGYKLDENQARVIDSIYKLHPDQTYSMFKPIN